MLGYFRRYVIIVCIVAVAIPVVVSTVWPLFTGTLMASTLPGLIALLVLLFGSLFVMQFLMGRKADALTQGYLSQYNDKCDPQQFLDEAESLEQAIQMPYRMTGSWFMSYWGQALLDIGQTEKARKILDNIRQSIALEKKPVHKADVLSNAVPLASKLEGPEAVVQLVDEGLGYLDEINEPTASPRRIYLSGQRDIAQAHIAGDDDALVGLYSTTRINSSLLMRIRVEYAWEEARIHYRNGDEQREKACLSFVAENGNRLALVEPARARLTRIA